MELQQDEQDGEDDTDSLPLSTLAGKGPEICYVIPVLFYSSVV